MELRVGNKYRLGRKIGSGSFGDIYLGKYFLSQSCNRIFLGIFLYIGGFMRKVSCLLAYYFSLIKSQDLSGLDNNLLIIDVR